MLRKSLGRLFGLSVGVALLCACSSATSGVSSVPVPAGASAFDGALQKGAASKAGYLYVSNLASGSVEVLENGTYKLVRSLADSLGPTGLYLDPSSNLYVANGFSYSVFEYASSATSPTCTYSADIKIPLAVATDPKGHVEIASFDNGQGIWGWIGEFNHCHNRMLRQRMVPGAPEGIAIDAAGDIFVSYINSGGSGSFAEFVKGSMTPKLLGATVGFSGAIVLDSHGNLVADDQHGAIDVIAPPFSKVRRLVTDTQEPVRLAFDRNQTLLFNANVYDGTVTVYSYPTGKLVKTLQIGGSFQAVGVADSPPAQ